MRTFVCYIGSFGSRLPYVPIYAESSHSRCEHSLYLGHIFKLSRNEGLLNKANASYLCMLFVCCLCHRRFLLLYISLFLYLSFYFPEVHRNTARRGTISYFAIGGCYCILHVLGYHPHQCLNVRFNLLRTIDLFILFFFEWQFCFAFFYRTEVVRGSLRRDDGMT